MYALGDHQQPLRRTAMSNVKKIHLEYVRHLYEEHYCYDHADYQYLMMQIGRIVTNHNEGLLVEVTPFNGSKSRVVISGEEAVSYLWLKKMARCMRAYGSKFNGYHQDIEDNGPQIAL